MNLAADFFHVRNMVVVGYLVEWLELTPFISKTYTRMPIYYNWADYIHIYLYIYTYIHSYTNGHTPSFHFRSKPPQHVTWFALGKIFRTNHAPFRRHFHTPPHTNIVSIQRANYNYLHIDLWYIYFFQSEYFKNQNSSLFETFFLL